MSGKSIPHAVVEGQKARCVKGFMVPAFEEEWNFLSPPWRQNKQ